jgi:Protein of unknown function (DUF3558)
VGLRVLALGVAAIAVLVGGCSAKEAGSPTGPAPTSGAGKQTGSPSTSSGSGGGSAPKVSNPLDASKFLTQPCSSIGPDKLRSLSVSAQGEPDNSPVGPTCQWIERDAGSSLEVGFLTGNKNGLADTYRGRDRFKGYFEPTQVDGYPAVFNDLRDFRGDGTCNITVGISDTLAFRTAVQDGKLGQKSCDRTKQAAAAVITTLKGA